MECKYYSAYPYAQKGYRESRKNGKRGTYSVFPFRLYKAAICRSVNPNESVCEFLWNCYEALDMPNAKGIADCSRRYELDGIIVFPTTNMYGATNPDDGAFVIDGRYYTIGDGGEICTHPNWDSAFNEVRKERGRKFKGGVDMTRM